VSAGGLASARLTAIAGHPRVGHIFALFKRVIVRSLFLLRFSKEQFCNWEGASFKTFFWLNEVMPDDYEG